MSKKLKKLLEKLNIENVDEVLAKINADDDSDEIIDTLLTKAQGYAKPFLEAEFNAKIKDERHASKGKGMKEALNIANETFGNILSNKEIEDVMKDPANEGKTINAAMKLIKEKISEKTGKSEPELQKMLDLANGKVSEYETKMNEMQAKFEKDLASGISAVKLKAVLNDKLISILPKYTNMPPAKAAKLISNAISEKAHLSLKGEDDISLHDVLDNAIPLKKNATELQTFEGLVSDIAKEYELPVAQSPGVRKIETNRRDENQDDNKPKISENASAMLAALEAATA